MRASAVVKDFIERLSDLQIRRPWVPLLLVAAVTLVFGYFAVEARAPDPLRRAPPRQPAERGGAPPRRGADGERAAVLILLEAPTMPRLRAMGDALVPALLALGPDTVSSAEDGIQEAKAFLAPRAGLFLTEKELEKLRDDVNARWDYEVAKETRRASSTTTGPPSPSTTSRSASEEEGEGETGRATRTAGRLLRAEGRDGARGRRDAPPSPAATWRGTGPALDAHSCGRRAGAGVAPRVRRHPRRATPATCRPASSSTTRSATIC